MSLHTLANHMAATGRGPDSTLVHMSPREVNGLQALAMANGGSLTINPQTGLPEAGFLENLLPALAGFALNAFAPGIGGAVGGMLGLGQAAGTGIAIGGATALASGSLEKGLMAGLGAYGGAGLGGNLLSAGDATMAGPPVSAMGLQEGAAAQAAAPVSTLERMQAGLGSVGAAPMDALKNNAGYIAAAAAPGLLGAFDDQPTSSVPKIHPGYIRKYDRNPETGSLYQVSATPADQYTEGMTFGGVPKRYDTGGVTFGGVGAAVDAQGNPLVANPQDTRSDSEKAQDYLSGKGPNPFLFYHKAPTVDPVAKAAEATKTLQEDIKQEQQQRSGGNSSRAMDDSGGIASLGGSAQPVYNPDVNSYTNGILPALLGQQAVPAPIVDTTGYKSAAEAESAQNQAAAAQYEQYRTLQQAQQEKTAADNATAAVAAQAQQDAETRAAQQAERQAAVERAVANENYSNQGNSSGNGGSGYSGAPAAGSDVGRSEPGSAHLSRGGYLSRYADGGGITALADGGMYNLGSYSDGGRLLRGPGDGVSDDIPATIGEKQPARLADGEFVVPARIVSELGNGSTEAGARKLYAMMDRVQKSRSKTTGKDRVAANTRADKYLPA